MFSKCIFYYWPDETSSKDDIPLWITSLLQNEQGTIFLGSLKNSLAVPSLCQHFSDLMASNHHGNSTCFIYHICPTVSSRCTLSASWRHFYYESFIVQDPSLKDSLHEKLSTPLLDRIFINTLRIPSSLEALIVTPLWISLCCADHYVYPSRLLPLFFSYPQHSFQTSPLSSMRLLLLGAKVQCKKKKPSLRDAHDRQLLLQACTQMNLNVADHYHHATHILWCFNDKGFFAKLHSPKTLQMKAKILQCLTWAKTHFCPIIHLEWLWKVYHEETFPSFEPYELTFQNLHIQCNVSKEDATQNRDFCCEEASKIWTCTKQFHSSTNETLFVYTSPVLPSFLSFHYNSKSLPSLCPKPLNETKNQQTTSCQDDLYNFPKKNIFFSLITNYLVETNVPYKTTQTAWIISSSFSLKEALAVASLLKQTFLLDHIFLANELCISILPLLLDACLKLRMNEEWNSVEKPQCLPTAQELFIVRLEKCENQCHAVCGCTLGQLQEGTCSNFSQFFPLCQQTTHTIVITKTSSEKISHQLKTFLTVLCDMSFTTPLINETASLTKLKEHSLVIKLSLLLFASLNSSTSHTQNSETKDYQTSNSTQSNKPFPSYLLNDSMTLREQWNITFITLGDTWETYFKKSSNPTLPSSPSLYPSLPTPHKQSFLHTPPITFQTVSLIDLLNSPFLSQLCKFSNTNLFNNTSRPQSIPTMKVLFQGYPYKNPILAYEKNIKDDVYQQIYDQLNHGNKNEYQELFSSISILHTDIRLCPYNETTIASKSLEPIAST